MLKYYCFLLILFGNLLTLGWSAKCSIVFKGDSPEAIVECSNVNKIEDFIGELSTNWLRLSVKNPIGRSFTLNKGEFYILTVKHIYNERCISNFRCNEYTVSQFDCDGLF